MTSPTRTATREHIPASRHFLGSTADHSRPQTHCKPIALRLHQRTAFGIGGEHNLTERELHQLTGWRNSPPVRVGNVAWNQRQVDVYGELLGAAHRLVAQLNPDHPGATEWREFLLACAEACGCPKPRHCC